MLCCPYLAARSLDGREPLDSMILREAKRGPYPIPPYLFASGAKPVLVSFYARRIPKIKSLLYQPWVMKRGRNFHSLPCFACSRT